MKRPSRRPGSAARWTTIAVAAAVLLAVPVFAQIQFSDVPDNDPHRRDIDAVAGERWFVGYRDGTYKPDQEISPSEMTRVLNRAFEGLTRAEFASFMVAGNRWQERVKEPLARKVTLPSRLYIVGYPSPDQNLDQEAFWWKDGYSYILPGKYEITDTGRRWMRLGSIPEGAQAFDTIAATDAPLAEYFQNEPSTEPVIIRILPTDTAFMITYG